MHTDADPAAAATPAKRVPPGLYWVRVIVAGGKPYRFEWHSWFGPNVVLFNGEVAKRQPGPRSPFWDAVTWWDKQGRRMNGDGTCRWDREIPAKPITRHLGGRHHVVTGWEPARTEPGG